MRSIRTEISCEPKRVSFPLEVAHKLPYQKLVTRERERKREEIHFCLFTDMYIFKKPHEAKFFLEGPRREKPIDRSSFVFAFLRTIIDLYSYMSASMYRCE